MKKNFILVIVMCLMLLPLSVLAEENDSKYVSENLNEVLERKGIEPEFDNYEENEDQVPIYLFYRTNCGYCERFLNFINSIVDEYGKYFKLVAYEVTNKNNSDLMGDVAKFTKKDGDGVPFIVIGDKVFEGYASSFDDDIKKAITKLYESDDKYDVLEEMKNPSKKSDTLPIVIISLIVVGGLGGLIFISRKNNQ